VVGSSRQCPTESRQPRGRLGAGAGHVQSRFLDRTHFDSPQMHSCPLLAEYECTEWGPAAGPPSSHAPVAISRPAGTQNQNADGTGQSTPPSALPSLVLPPLSMLFVSSQGEGQHHSNSEAQQQAGDRPPADPSQRIITAHLMQCWKEHQFVLGHVALARSEEYLKFKSVQRIPAVPKDERDMIFREYFPQTMSTPTLCRQILQRLLKRRGLGTLTGALFLGWLTCLLNVLSLASVWTYG